MIGPATAMDPLNEALRRAKAGDLAAFEEILRRYERQVLGTALRLLGRLEDAQDAAQEVFLRLHKHLGRLKNDRSLSPWLYRVTVNVCRDVGRKRQSAQLVELEDLPSPASAEQEFTASERRGMLKRALASLPEKERAAIVLRDIEGLDTSEVAKILGSSEATVRSQVSTARVKLKKFVDAWLRRSV